MEYLYKLHLFFDESTIYIPERKILAVDGTCINLTKNYEAEHLIKSRSGLYISALVSCLYNINRNIPISYKLYEKKDERRTLLEQLKYLHKGEIVIMDRGYFSAALIYELKKRYSCYM
jgi:hypothetical protein